MSTAFGRFVGSALDPAHWFYKPDAPADANRDAAINASKSAENTAMGDAQQRLAQIYGGTVQGLGAATGAAADQARARQAQIDAAVRSISGWQPGQFDALSVPVHEVTATGAQQPNFDAATAARVAQNAQQRTDMQPLIAGQQGLGPSVAAAQQATALDAARRQAGMMAAASHGGNVGLAARAAMLTNTEPQAAVQGAQARGNELANLRGQVDTGTQRLFGNQLGLAQSAQQMEQLRNQEEIANRQMLARQAGLASDAFGQSVRDYKVGNALTNQAQNAQLNAYDTSMQDQENAFASYQDYLRSLYGTGLDTAVRSGQRAAGTLDTILGAQRQQDAANAGLVSTLIGGIMSGVKGNSAGSGASAVG